MDVQQKTTFEISFISNTLICLTKKISPVVSSGKISFSEKVPKNRPWFIAAKLMLATVEIATLTVQSVEDDDEML